VGARKPPAVSSRPEEAELEKAQDNLRDILSARQEAVAVPLGLLK
jgi:hypothetical protein